jgi:YbbR domain-containing protein
MIGLLRDFFTRNWGLKLLAFILAFLLWLVLIPEEKTYSEKTLTVSLETRNIPQDMELVEKPAATVDVTIKAKNRLLNEISASSVFARLDLDKASVYQDIYPLSGASIVLPPGAEVVSISPNMIRLKLEKTKQMDLEVAPMIVGKIGEGYKIAKIEVTPARVPVKGAESKIKARDKVLTSPVDISLFTRSQTVIADIILPRPDLRLATSLTKVRIDIILEENGKPAGGRDPAKNRVLSPVAP